ncbi:MAG: beta-CASP ribonuclease aCPSF1, partial [Promethearchaeota archaeon]
MSSEDLLNQTIETIKKSLPPSIHVTDITYEGPEIAVYTMNPKILVDNGSILKNLAKQMRKRIVVRSDPSVRKPREETAAFIRETTPDEAEITKIIFDDNIGEVSIEAKKPGLVIGKGGETLKRIRLETLWRPTVIRTPPIDSRTVKIVRHMLKGKTESEQQKEIRRKIGRRIHRPLIFKTPKIRVTTLGGFREVGRSCVYVQTQESNVLLDCGVNVGSNQHAFPFFDTNEFRIEDLDAVIVSHAHLDHSGLVPYLYKYGYEGPVYSTLPTRNLSTMLQLDYIQISHREGRVCPYSKRDVKEEVLHWIPLSYGEVTDIAPDIKLTLHNSGHIIGGAMIHLHFGEGAHNLVYTGDFKFQKTRLLEPASVKFPRLETLITESTYGGVKDHIPSRHESEKELINIVNETVRRGGKILIPVLAVGRAQEIIIILEEFLSRGLIDPIPVYIDGMISEATAIHTTHPEFLSKDLREKIFHQGHNPFTSEFFTQVDSMNAREDIIEGEPCIVMATSGMLNGGPSVQYLKGLADDPKNTLLFVSYQVEGTLGRRIQKGFREFQTVDGRGRQSLVRVKLDIATIEGFSGHSSRSQIMSFIRKIKPKPEKVVTNHGEASKCMGLASLIHKRLKIETRAPQNLETIVLK